MDQRFIALNAPKDARATYIRALDDRKRPMRGLWMRGERYYAQLTFHDAQTGRPTVRRICLKATTVGAGRKELEKLKTEREEELVPPPQRAPSLRTWIADYLAFISHGAGMKRASTIQKEKGCLSMWAEMLGDLKLNELTPAHLERFIASRQSAGMSGRTIHLDLIALRNCLKRAVAHGYIKTLPTQHVRAPRWQAPLRSLVPLEDIEAICTKALEESKNGQQFVDYVRLMAYCGGRRSETLRLKWSDIDWPRKQLTIGSDGLSKSHKARQVDFNPKLEGLLGEMHGRRAPDTDWIFPSPQRGDKDIAAKSFQETLKIARAAARRPGFGFHDCRHFFISMCVMSGIDFMTIAACVGHADGGILIGKVYGHLADEHRRRMAGKLVF